MIGCYTECSNLAIAYCFCDWISGYITKYLNSIKIIHYIAVKNDNVLTVRSTNFTVALAGTPDNLDQKFTVNIDTTDPDNLLRKELDRIPLDTTEKILLTYRAYSSDDLTEPQPCKPYKSNPLHIIAEQQQSQPLHLSLMLIVQVSFIRLVDSQCCVVFYD